MKSIGCVNGGAGERSIFVQAVHDVFGGKNLGVGASDDLLGLGVNAVDKGLSVALRADLLHVDLRLQVVGPMGADCVGEVPARADRMDCG